MAGGHGHGHLEQALGKRAPGRVDRKVVAAPCPGRRLQNELEGGKPGKIPACRPRRPERAEPCLYARSRRALAHHVPVAGVVEGKRENERASRDARARMAEPAQRHEPAQGPSAAELARQLT